MKSTVTLENEDMTQIEQILAAVTEIRRDQVEQAKTLSVHGEKLSSIDNRFEKLNGTVARHEETLSQQLLVCAARKSLGDMVPELNKRVILLEQLVARDERATEIAEKTKKQSSESWLRWLQPLAIAGILGILGVILTLMLSHSSLFGSK